MTNHDELERAVERLSGIPNYIESSASARMGKHPYPSPIGEASALYAADLRLILSANRETREMLAEAMFTADRLRKRVTPDWIGLPREHKDQWRNKARQALSNTQARDGEGA